MMRRIFWVVAMVGVSVPGALGQNRYAADFLDIGVGARSLAMGGAGVAAATGPTGALWNPACVKGRTLSELRFHHSVYESTLADLNYLGYARPLTGSTTLSVSALRFAVDGIPRFPELDSEGSAARRLNDGRPTGEPEGYFAAEDLAFHLTLAAGTDRWVDFGWFYNPFPLQMSVGASLKYISQALDDHVAVGLGFDVGALMRVGMAELIGVDALGQASVGFSLTDIAGTRITWDTASRSAGDIPFRIRLGSEYRQPLPFQGMSLAMVWDSSWDLQDGGRAGEDVGAEMGIREAVFLRIGDHSGDFAAGVGIRSWKLDLDYAFLTAGAVPSHRIDLAFFPER